MKKTSSRAAFLASFIVAVFYTLKLTGGDRTAIDWVVIVALCGGGVYNAALLIRAMSRKNNKKS
jgi:hypothetical protein